MKLYWVITEDHDEDWFVIASNEDEASKFHLEAEGYDELEDVFAEEILTIPENIPTKTGWPTEENLLALGAKMISTNSPRVVEIEGRTFCEGLLEGTLNELNDDIFEKAGLTRLNKTKKQSLH